MSKTETLIKSLLEINCQEPTHDFCGVPRFACPECEDTEAVLRNLRNVAVCEGQAVFSEAEGYEEHHIYGILDVGIAWNHDRVWVCLDGASTFRAKIYNGKLWVDFWPNMQPTE